MSSEATGGTGILGEVCVDARELTRAASARKKPYHERKVPHSELQSFENKGWELVRKLKNTTKIRKKKTEDESFEDRVWRVFYTLDALLQLALS